MRPLLPHGRQRSRGLLAWYDPKRAATAVWHKWALYRVAPRRRSLGSSPSPVELLRCHVAAAAVDGDVGQPQGAGPGRRLVDRPAPGNWQAPGGGSCCSRPLQSADSGRFAIHAGPADLRTGPEVTRMPCHRLPTSSRPAGALRDVAPRPGAPIFTASTWPALETEWRSLPLPACMSAWAGTTSSPAA